MLHAWYNWTSTVARPRRRELWSHIYSWLVRPEQRNAVVEYIERRSLMNHLMQGGTSHTDAAYLGELPWSVSRDNDTMDWQPIWDRENWESTGLEVSPSWEEYCWEGNVLDCSLDEAVRAWYPAPILFHAGDLAWKPGSREWHEPAGTTVARFIESGSHSVLLVREDWIKQTLRKDGLVIVFGWLGEKRFIELDALPFLAHPIGMWTEINSVASLEGQRWTFGKRRFETRAVELR